MFDKFTDEAKTALNIARQAATHAGAPELDDVHILIGCCRTPESLAARVMLGCGQDPSEICARAETRAAQLGGKSTRDGQLPFTASAKHVLVLAMQEAESQGHRSIGSQHFLLAILRLGNDLSVALARGGLSHADAYACAVAIDVDGTVDTKPATRTNPLPRDTQIALLRSAELVCAQIQEHELATKLRELAHRLETSR